MIQHAHDTADLHRLLADALAYYRAATGSQWRTPKPEWLAGWIAAAGHYTGAAEP